VSADEIEKIFRSMGEGIEQLGQHLKATK